MNARSRTTCALSALFVLVTGLFWRSHIASGSPFLAKYGGDALWALLIFIGFGFVFARLSTLKIALCTLAFTWSVEFLQLYHAEWIDHLRSTRLGSLILGSVFNLPDLAAYVVGILLGMIADQKLRQSTNKNSLESINT